MLTMFNRRELLITFRMEEQARIRGLLASHGIEYQIRTENLSARASRGRAGSFGIDPDAAYEYKIYVHRKDYQRAKALL